MKRNHIVALALGLSLLTGCQTDLTTGTFGEDASEDVAWADLADAGSDALPDSQVSLPELTSIEIVENPRNVLSAIVNVETSLSCRVYVEYGEGTDYGMQTRLSATGTSHEIVVVQMRELTDHHLRIVAVTGSGELVTSADRLFTTGPLPDVIPSFDVTYSEEGLDSAITLFFPGRPEGSGSECSSYVGVDRSGEVVWYYRLTENSCLSDVGDITPLPNGNLLISIAGEMGMAEITLAGEIVRELMSTDLGYANFHHEAIKLPNGRYMTLTNDGMDVEADWSEETVFITGDIIVELDQAGETTWEWSTLDYLDTQRFPGEFSHGDWTHSNAVVYLEEDNSVLLSSRHQNWVIKIDRSTDEIIWRLGAGGDFELTNTDSGAAWFASQHAPEMRSDGTILIYDNGNERPAPNDGYSRAVIYRLDEEEMEAQEVWSYQTPYFTHFQGDANTLGNGNILVCAGGTDSPGVPQIIEVTSDSTP